MALQSNADLRLLNGLLPVISIDQTVLRPHLRFPNCWLFRGGVVAPRQTPNLEGQVSIFISPGDWVAQLYPQAPSTHFSRLLRHAWATVGLFFSPVTTRGAAPRLLLKIVTGSLHIWRPSPPSTTWGRAMPLWQRLALHGNECHDLIQVQVVPQIGNGLCSKISLVLCSELDFPLTWCYKRWLGS
jgi:hypothetical protein